MTDIPVRHPLLRLPAILIQIAAFWLIISPWFLPRPYPPAAIWATFGSGIVALALGGYQFLRPLSVKMGWIGIAFSLWVLFAPWIAGFAGSASGTYNHAICATILAIAFSWSLTGAISVPRLQAS